MENALSQPASNLLYFESAPFTQAVGQKARYGFFGRRGGVSKGVYNALNCGPGSDDDVDNVKRNRRIVAEAVGAQAENILSLYQMHGTDCVVVDSGWPVNDRPRADAMVTDKPGYALGILTADCAPVLFYGQKSDGSPVIGAAHAGWKGALAGIQESALAEMEKLGADRNSIHACIGPCISRSSYEVSEAFYKDFLKDDEDNERFFPFARQEGHYMFDLAGYCAMRLHKSGVRKVYIKDTDTYFNENDFFSYRRATHRKEKDYGRQISLIMIIA